MLHILLISSWPMIHQIMALLGLKSLCQSLKSGRDMLTLTYPICSMYGTFTNMCPKNHPNVGKYTIHGAYGYVGVWKPFKSWLQFVETQWFANLKNPLTAMWIMGSTAAPRPPQKKKCGYVYLLASFLVSYIYIYIPLSFFVTYYDHWKFGM